MPRRRRSPEAASSRALDTGSVVRIRPSCPTDTTRPTKGLRRGRARAPPAEVARASTQTDSGAGTAALQWIHAAYVLAFALRLITGGRLGDLDGRRRIILTGTAVFTLPCPLCGIAAGPELLIAARVVQGAAAAAMVPQDPGTLHVTFDAGSRAKAFGLYRTVMSLGSVTDPDLGGVLARADLFGLGLAPRLPDQPAHRDRRRHPRAASPVRVPRAHRPPPGPARHAPVRARPAADHAPAHGGRWTRVATLVPRGARRRSPRAGGVRSPAKGQDAQGRLTTGHIATRRCAPPHWVRARPRWARCGHPVVEVEVVIGGQHPRPQDAGWTAPAHRLLDHGPR
ncbi:MFS transporter [Streptomyces sp. NPDC048387]|uniref:MFS transporter n=1 Tax=Streptomyces sp. NPDC048387 TaxID=3365542 RepID=UPI0037145A2A